MSKYEAYDTATRAITIQRPTTNDSATDFYPTTTSSFVKPLPWTTLQESSFTVLQQSTTRPLMPTVLPESSFTASQPSTTSPLASTTLQRNSYCSWTICDWLDDTSDRARKHEYRASAICNESINVDVTTRKPFNCIPTICKRLIHWTRRVVFLSLTTSFSAYSSGVLLGCAQANPEGFCIGEAIFGKFS